MQEQIEPGRYRATVTINGVRDHNAIIGYDYLLASFFFQSGLKGATTEGPLVWLGTSYGQFPTFSALTTVMEITGVQLLEWERG